MARGSAKVRDGFAEAPTRERRKQSLDRLCATAASIFEAKLAALVLHQHGVSRVIASSGLEPRYRSLPWSFDSVAYDRDTQKIVPDASADRSVEAALHFLGLAPGGFFLRTPALVEADWSLALIIADPAPRPKPKARDMALLASLKTLVATEFHAVSALLTDPDADVTVAMTLGEARRHVEESEIAAALIDTSLSLTALNPRMERLIGAQRGSTLESAAQVPMLDSIRMLCRRALETKLSPPDFEIVTGGGGQPLRAFQITVSPFSPIGTRDYFLFVTAREVTELNRRTRSLAKRIARGRNGQTVEPTLAFLQETLVERRSIRARHAVHYLTLRSWRTPIREWQIKALRALKGNIPLEMPEAIAEEIFREVTALTGFAAFRAIVPVPCTHSTEPNCLSLAVARALSLSAQAPVIQALSAIRMEGSSHPKENLKRKPFVLAQAVSDPVLLIDDVATSGQHIEEAVRLLKPSAGSVLAVAWIGGDAV